MKLRDLRRWGEEGEERLTAVLTAAVDEAWRAASVASSARWSAFAFLLGAVLGGGVAAFRGETANPLLVAASVATSLTAGFVSFCWAAVKRRKARGKRSEAASAARRLERRFPELKGVLVAAVDFCEEDLRDSEVATGASGELRRATIEDAKRRLAAVAFKTDEAEWRAVLTGEPLDRFCNAGKIGRSWALGALANLALGVSSVVWGDWAGATTLNSAEAGLQDGRSTRFGGEKKESGEEKRQDELARKSEEKEEGKEEGKEGEKGKEGRNSEKSEEGKAAPNESKQESGEESAGEATSRGAENAENKGGDEEISLAALELLASDLARSAEIAQSLKAELVNAASAERLTAEERLNWADAIPTLQLARELETNLRKPNAGVWAQVRKLEELAQIEKAQVLERWKKLGGLRDRTERRLSGKLGEEEKIEGLGEQGKFVGTIAGREIAVGTLLKRMKIFGAKFNGVDRLGAANALGLSAVARNDSASERAQLLERAARRVDDWETTLRREETALRILAESWRYDATSQVRAAFWREAIVANRALLARFAGVSPFEGRTALNEKELDDAKLRFTTAWGKARAAENEAFAIVERTRARLQNENAAEFIAFIAAEEKGKGREEKEEMESEKRREPDAAASASLAESLNKKTLELVENNRFGALADLLQRDATSLIGEPKTTKSREKKQESDVATLEIKEDALAAEERRTFSDEALQQRRFTALAVSLTRGVDAESSRRRGQKNLLADESEGTGRRGEGTANEKRTLSDAASLRGKEIAEKSNGDETSGKSDAASLDGAGGEALEKTASTGEKNEEKIKAEGVLTADETSGWENSENKGELTSDLTNDNSKGEIADAGAPGETNGTSGTRENEKDEGRRGVGKVAGASSGGAAPKEKEMKDSETTENKAFIGELPQDARRRFEGTEGPTISPEYAEKIRLYRRRIANERRL